ncbi:uncharacterized protein ATNIH1004_001253 [Aspergillus tanneri]|uniref:Uncharacterized protein n=1 Tax=Aspergillus tanneri TaxID=1220188 RepID=A0A5M9N5L4_9EURO|nr:uncharacterized protein ATNIH1004_001253 [Aspergillus tanneri]KAA8652349.1 hypothetical protein ATNIH1004_001253 [Aspergillus tanneri]
MASQKDMLRVAEIPVDSCDSRPQSGRICNEPSTEKSHSTAPKMAGTSSSAPDSRRTPKRKRTGSPPSPSLNTPPQCLRSASRSTRRCVPPSSRHSSFSSHHRAATVSSLTPSLAPSLDDEEIRRQDLLSLHRESCRLFQNNRLSRFNEHNEPPSSSAGTHTPPRTVHTYSNISTPPLSPVLSGQLIDCNSPVRVCSVFSDAHGGDPILPIQSSATVIDWTSPSTRRREYEKIDRASSGMRGFWRRVAPRWCQSRDNRTPFFEEGKDGKGNYEGSVRRFRMDLPDEPVTENKVGLKLKRKLVVGRIGTRRRSGSA